MTPLDWKWVAIVWGYALIWFLITDRIKLLGYRLLDPAHKTTSPDKNDPSDGTPAPEEGTPAPEEGTPAPEHDTTHGPSAAATAAFYTDTDPGDPVFHDNTDCPYGQEIKNNHNDHPGTDHRRRCTWCTEHDQPADPARTDQSPPPTDDVQGHPSRKDPNSP